jgi:hypothetical protein
MRADDPADPEAVGVLTKRISGLASRIRANQEHERLRQERLNTIRTHVDLSSRGVQTMLNRQAIIEATVAIVSEGTSPSNIELREALIPIAPQLSEDAELPGEVQLVLREIDRFDRSQSTLSEDLPASTPTAEVVEAAELLKGKSVVLIGGVPTPERKQALQAALKLKEIDWIGGKERSSYTGFEPNIACPEVAVVLLATRWASKSFSKAKGICEKYGKPLVRLPGGLGPNQVAVQILRQCGKRLRARKLTKKPKAG